MADDNEDDYVDDSDYPVPTGENKFKGHAKAHREARLKFWRDLQASYKAELAQATKAKDQARVDAINKKIANGMILFSDKLNNNIFEGEPPEGDPKGIFAKLKAIRANPATLRNFKNYDTAGIYDAMKRLLNAGIGFSVDNPQAVLAALRDQIANSRDKTPGRLHIDANLPVFLRKVQQEDNAERWAADHPEETANTTRWTNQGLPAAGKTGRGDIPGFMGVTEISSDGDEFGIPARPVPPAKRQRVLPTQDGSFGGGAVPQAGYVQQRQQPERSFVDFGGYGYQVGASSSASAPMPTETEGQDQSAQAPPVGGSDPVDDFFFGDSGEGGTGEEEEGEAEGQPEAGEKKGEGTEQQDQPQPEKEQPQEQDQTREGEETQQKTIDPDNPIDEEEEDMWGNLYESQPDE